jgi:Ca-activated chloride channel family protein
VDAGDIGAGHTVTAIYEVTPVGSPARLSDPLRYQSAVSDSDTVRASTEWGYLRLRYKEPGSETSQLIEQPIAPVSQLILDDVYFGVAIAGFGELLRGNSRFVDWSYAEAISYAERFRGDDPFGYRSEAINLMRLAESIDQ